MILKVVLNKSPDLDLMFQALADRGRRSMIERLSRGPASVSELAAPLEMSLSAVVQHLAVLEASGIVRSEKVGRVRTCSLQAGALSQVEQWVAARRTGWERRLDALGAFLDAEEP
jgi:DNA-binding transcriptional ArsR family regulator